MTADLQTQISQMLTNITGSWGRWQTKMFLFFIIIAISSCWHSLLLVFIAPSVQHWCVQPLSTKENESQCVVDSGGQHCTKWEYDVGTNVSFYKSTIVSEWDLVCDRRWLASLTQSVYMIGVMISVLFMSHFSDKYGRKPIVIVGFVLSIMGSVSCAFSFSIFQFFLSRFLVAFGIATCWSTGFVLLTEITGPKYREIVGLAIQIGWAIGYIILPAVAYILRDFRWILITCTVFQLTQLFFFGSLSESPRWLLTKGRLEEAIEVLRHAMELNKPKTNTNNNNDNIDQDKLDKLRELVLLKEKEESQLINNKKKFTILDLFKNWSIAKLTLIVYFQWFVNSLVYYGLSFNTSKLGGNTFLNFLFLGLVEFPAYILCIYATKKYGQRMPLLVTMVGAGVGCFGAIFIEYNYIAGFTFAMIGKFCVTCSFAIIYVYSAEIYPTVIRTIGLGTSSMVARFGSMLSPFLKELSEETSLTVVFMLLGVLSVLAGVFILFLHEVQGVELADRPEDIVMRQMATKKENCK